MNTFNSIIDALATIRNLFAGSTVEFQNNEMRRNECELQVPDIPGFEEDRKNLKKDRDEVIQDYYEVVKKKKFELSC